MDQFKWTEKQVGISLAIVGALVGGVQGGLIRYTNPRLGNEKSVYIGLLLYALGMALFAFASQGWMMYAFLFRIAWEVSRGQHYRQSYLRRFRPTNRAHCKGA